VWDASLAVLLQTGASHRDLDLGQVISVRHLALQADANDTTTSGARSTARNTS